MQKIIDDELYSHIVDGIKEGMRIGYSQYSKLFSNDIICWDHTEVRHKATEYFFTVHVAEQVYSECEYSGITVYPEMPFGEICNAVCLKRDWDTSDIMFQEWQRGSYIEEIEDSNKRVDIALLQKSQNGLFHHNRVISLIEIKSIDQSLSNIKKDVDRLSGFFLMEPHEKDYNSLECAFSVSVRLMDHKTLARNNLDSFTKDEKRKLQNYIDTLPKDSINYAVESFTVRSQGVEIIQREEDDFEVYDGRQMELVGFIVKMTKKP